MEKRSCGIYRQIWWDYVNDVIQFRIKNSTVELAVVFALIIFKIISFDMSNITLKSDLIELLFYTIDIEYFY